MRAALLDRWRSTRDRHPLGTILVVAAALRLAAAIFSRGYMASDDHFEVVELAAEWTRGNPVFLDGQERFYRTLLYPGIHWAIMALCHALGLVHPDGVMTIVRLLLGAFSLWTVAIVYRYGEALGGRSAAWTAGWLAAAHAILPYASVRSFVEMAAAPFLLYSLYRLHLARAGESWARAASAPEATSPRRRHPSAETSSRGPGARRSRSGFVSPLLAGLAFGCAFVLRVHVAAAGIGIAAYLLWRGRPAVLLGWLAGAAVPIALQGLWDLHLYGTFLGSAAKYVEFNRENLHGYVVGPIYRHLLTIVGVFLPPFGILFLAAMSRGIREQGALFWAAAAFLLVHSLLPQKQERFLLPIFPALILMGTYGLAVWVRDAGSTFRRWVRAGWRSFWAINVPVLLLATFHYGQRARIVPLVHLYERGGARGIVLDLTEEEPGIPRYYLDGGRADRPLPVFHAVRGVEDLERLRARLAASRPAASGGESPADGAPGEEAPGTSHPGVGEALPPALPEYVLIFSHGRFREHVDRISRGLASVEVVCHSPPGLIDRVLRAVNPRYNHSKESWLARLKWPAG